MRPPPGQPGPRGIRRVAFNSLFLVLSRVLELAITVCTMGLVARYLGVAEFGLFATLAAISFVIRPLIDFGALDIVCREMARDATHARQYVASAVLSRALFSVVILLVVGAALAAYGGPRPLTWGVLLAVATELVLSLGTTYLYALRSYQRMEYELFVNIAHKLCLFVFLLLAIRLSVGVAGIMGTRLLAAGVFAVLAAGFLHARYVRLSLRMDWSFVRALYREAYPLAIFSVLLTLIFQGDLFLLNLLGHRDDVAFFEAPTRLILQAQMFPMAVSMSLFPLLARAAADPTRDRLIVYYRQTWRFMLLAGTAISALMLVAAGPLVPLIYGAAFRPAVPALVILSPAVVILGLNAFQNFFLTAVGRQADNTRSTAVALGVNLLLDVVCIPRYGFLGASVAKLAVYVLIVALNTHYIARCGVRLDTPKLVLKFLAAGLFACAAVRIGTPYAILTLVVRLLVAGALYGAALAALKLVTPADLRRLKEMRSGRHSPPEAAEA